MPRVSGTSCGHRREAFGYSFLLQNFGIGAIGYVQTFDRLFRDGAYGYTLMELRHLDIPAELLLDAAAQRVGGHRLSMRQIRLPGRSREVAEPLHDLGVIRMRREVLEQRDLGTYRHMYAMHLDGSCSGGEVGSSCARTLESGQKDRVAGIGTKRLDMMRHPPSCNHAAGRDDDDRITT